MESSSEEEERPDEAGLEQAAGWQQLDPAMRTVWSIQYGALWAALSLAAFIYDLLHLFAADRWLPFGVLTGGIVVAGLAFSLVWPRLRYRYWRYALREEELYLERGVLNRVHTIVPFRRIQHIDVSQNILEREFGLGKLIVHTAGTRSADVVVPGLPHERAERLRDAIRRYVLAHEGEGF